MSTGQLDLFAQMNDQNVKPNYVNCMDWSDKVRLYNEKQLLGLYLSGHPIDAYRMELIQYCGDVTLNNMIPGAPDSPNLITVGAVVNNAFQRISSKDGNKFYTMTWMTEQVLSISCSLARMPKSMLILKRR